MVKIRELLFMARSSNDDWKIAPSFRSSRYKRRWEGKNTVIHYYQREPQWVLVRVIFLPLPEEKWPGYLHSYEGDGMEEQQCPLMASSLQFFPSAGWTRWGSCNWASPADSTTRATHAQQRVWAHSFPQVLIPRHCWLSLGVVILQAAPCNPTDHSTTNKGRKSTSRAI